MGINKVKKNEATKIAVIGNGSVSKDNNGFHYVENSTGELMLGLAALNYAPTFFDIEKTFIPNNDILSFVIEKNPFEYFPIQNKNVFYKIKSIFFLIRILKNYKFVYVFYPGTISTIAALILIFLRRKFGLYLRGQFINEKRIHRIIVSKSSFILAVSQKLKIDLIKHADKTRVIRPMISVDEGDIYKRLELTETPKIWKLLFVGRITERKGIFDLLEAAKLLNLQNFSFQLRIVGGGDLFSYLMSRKGKKEYEAAHIFIQTSHDEGFPRTLYEAMTKSLPIITTMVGGIPGVMIDGYNCKSIPTKKPKEIVQIIIQESKNLQKLNNYGLASLETMGKVFSNKNYHHVLLEREINNLKNRNN